MSRVVRSQAARTAATASARRRIALAFLFGGGNAEAPRASGGLPFLFESPKMKLFPSLALLIAAIATGSALNHAAFLFTPNAGKGLWTKSLDALQKGQPNLTLRNLRPLLLHDPHNHVYLSLQAEAFRAKREWVAAAEIGERLLTSKRPKIACDHLTASYRALGLDDKLRNSFERCLKLEPDNVNGLFELAALYEKSGELELAEKLYARLAPSPSFKGARASLKRVRQAMKNSK